MHIIKVIWLVAFLWSPLALAQQVAAPLGLELGKATCKEATRTLKLRSDSKSRISSWAGGPIRDLPPGAGSVPGLKGGLLICDAQDRVVFVAFDFAKGNDEAARTADQLDTKYKPNRRDLPTLGNGYASWSAANGVIELDAPHVSFEFRVSYWATGAPQTYARWRELNQQQRDRQKAGNL